MLELELLMLMLMLKLVVHPRAAFFGGRVLEREMGGVWKSKIFNGGSNVLGKN